MNLCVYLHNYLLTTPPYASSSGVDLIQLMLEITLPFPKTEEYCHKVHCTLVPGHTKDDGRHVKHADWKGSTQRRFSANNAHAQINAQVDTEPSLGRPASFGYWPGCLAWLLLRRSMTSRSSRDIECPSSESSPWCNSHHLRCDSTRRNVAIVFDLLYIRTKQQSG